MEMHQIRYFLAVARMLNFTRAAEECHVAQPSLTRAIKQLEEELGGDLFRRERNLSHLTEFGQRMLPFLQQCYESAHSAKQLAQSLKTGNVQPLSVAMSHAVNITVIIDHLTELTRSFSGLEIRFLRGTANEIGEFLKKGEADVAIAGKLDEDWGRLDAWPLFTEKIYLAVNLEHPLARTPAFDLTKLAKERLIARAYCETFSNFESVLKERQVTPGPGHQTFSEQDLIAMLEANLGVGLLPESAPKSNKIKLIPLEGIDFNRTVHCYGVAGRQRSAAAATLIKMLRAADWTQLAA